MKENEEQLEMIELGIKQANKNINAMKALERLTGNKDFTNLILEGYFKEEASRLVLLRADPSFNDIPSQNELLKAIDSIGQFKMYCNTIMQMGRASQRAIEADEQTREEILAEAV